LNTVSRSTPILVRTITSGKAGRTDVLDRSLNLSAWVTITTQGPLASDGTVTLSDPASTGDAFFYRIRVSGP